MEKFSKKKSLDEMLHQSSNNKNRLRGITSPASFEIAPTPVKSSSASPASQSVDVGGDGGGGDSSESSRTSSPQAASKRHPPHHHHGFKFSSLFNSGSSGSEKQHQSKPEPTTRGSIEPDDVATMLTLDSHQSDEYSTTSTVTNTSTRALYKLGGATNVQATSTHQQQSKPAKKRHHFLNSSFSSSVSSTSSPPMSPVVLPFSNAAACRNSILSKVDIASIDSRRPTVEEVRRELGKLPKEDYNDDESSEWSSISSLKPSTSKHNKHNHQVTKKPNHHHHHHTTSSNPLEGFDAGDYDEEDFMDAFRVFDTNGDGRITAKELNHVLKELGIKMSRGEIKKMIGELDKDGNGTIEYSEFVAMMSAPASRESDEFELREAFKCIDLDGNGFISRDELRDAVRKCVMSTDSKVSMQDVEEMMREADTDGNGLIDFDEFVRVLVEKRN